MTGMKRGKANCCFTTGVAKRSHSALITSTALALLLSVGGAFADAPSVNTSGVKAVKGEKKTFHEEIIKTGDVTWAHAAIATDGGELGLEGGTIVTIGERAYGLLAEYGGSITSNADITTDGKVAHAVQAGSNGTNSTYDGSTKGTIFLTGGTITVNADNGASWASALHAVDQGVINASKVIVKSVSYAALSESQSAISIADSEIDTTGSVSALVANNDRRKNAHDADSAGGNLTIANTMVSTSGNNVELPLKNRTFSGLSISAQELSWRLIS